MSTGTERAGSGSADIARRLKAEVDNYPVRLRPGLAGEAFRAHRRHRAMRRSIVAAGVAVVIAAGAAFLAAGTIPFGAAPGGQQPIGPVRPGVIPAQGVLPPASLQPTPPGNDLTAQQAAGDIVWTRTTYPGPPGSASDSVADLFRYAGATSTIVYLSGGKLSRETSSDAAVGPTATTVDYQQRTWSRSTGSALGDSPLLSQSPCQIAEHAGLWGLTNAANPAPAHELLSCLGLPVAQGQIGGVDTISLTEQDGVTIWLNATTYLPVQLVMQTDAPGQEYTARFGYLPPTTANLAYLAAVIPHGFSHVSVAGNPGNPGNPGGSSGPPAQVWLPPAGVIPPFGLQPTAASDSLTATQAAGDIQWARTTTSAIPASDTLIDSTFNYRSASRDLTYYPDGKPWDDDETYVKRGADGKPASVHTVVLYDRRTVSVQTTPDATDSSQPASDQDVCAIAQTSGLADIAYPLTAGQARSLLSCQGQAVTRGLTFDGVDAIKITGSHGETLWMNATTSLPIEIVIVNATGDYPPAGYNSAPSPGEVIQFTWLPPTPANLAYVGIPTPAGFTTTS
jgi:hypothetical protein